LALSDHGFTVIRTEGVDRLPMDRFRIFGDSTVIHIFQVRRFRRGISWTGTRTRRSRSKSRALGLSTANGSTPAGVFETIDDPDRSSGRAQFLPISGW